MGMDRAIKKKRFPVKWVLGIGALLAASVTFIYQMRYADKSPVIYANKKDIRTFEARKDSFQEYINIIGRVVSSRTSYIDSLETGTVKKLLAEEGDFLSEGQILLVMENDQIETSLRLKESQILEKKLALVMEQDECGQEELAMQEELLDVEHELNELKKAYLRNKELYESGHAVTKSVFEKIEDDYNYWRKKEENLKLQHRMRKRLMAQALEKSRIGLAVLETEKERLEQQIANLVVKVATAGLLTKLEASVGEIKTIGSRIAQFDVIRPVKIEADIDEYYLNKVMVNYEGSFEFEISKHGKKTFHVVTTMIHPEVENNMFTVDMAFKGDPETTFTLGQTFDIKLALGQPREVVVIRKGPFIQDTGANWVYVLDEEKSKAFKRRIKPGRQNPEYLEVLEGLEPGEKIIISRYDTYENLKVITIK